MKKWLLLVLVLHFAGAAVGSIPKRIVKPNDTVSLHCDEETSLSHEYTVTKDGFIVMRYLGAEQVAGLTEQAAAGKIAQDLIDEKILRKATVELNVLSSTSGQVTYDGAVENSGSIAPKAGLRLSDVVQAAHPLNVANLQRVKITTAAGNEFIVNYASYDGSSNMDNPELRNGDNVFFDYATGYQPPRSRRASNVEPPASPLKVVVPSGEPPIQLKETGPEKLQYVSVMGAVLQPRTILLEKGMTVSQAINRAGGLLKTSNSKEVKIDRKLDGTVHTLYENLADVSQGLAGDVSLRPDDVIQVQFQGRSRGPSRAFKIGAAILLGLVLLHP